MKPYYRVYDAKEYTTHGDKFECPDLAERLALELATKYPGSTFEILRCVGIAQCSKANTFWMDGEEPPEKPRYRMLEYGEIIQPGDEYDDDGTWRPRTLTIGEKVSADNRLTRRPL